MGEGSMKLVFLGGPKDGEKMPVDRSAKRLVFPIPMPPMLGSRNELEDAPTILEARWVYVYEKFAQKNNLGDVRLVMQYKGEEQL